MISTKRRNVITKAFRTGWEQFVRDRPDDEFDELEMIVSESLPMSERPKQLKQDHMIPFQHPDFQSIYFLVTMNADQELVFIGLRTLRNGPAKDSGEPNAVTWDDMPDFGDDHAKQIEWCQKQTAIAFGRLARNLCPSNLANARIQELTIYSKMAKRKHAEASVKAKETSANLNALPASL